jgi:hypothetical protein
MSLPKRVPIVILDADNGNQTLFLASLRVVAATLGATSFLTKNRSYSRPATRSDLLGTSVKLEPQEVAEDADDNDEDAADAEGGAFNPIDPENYGDLDVDDVEAAVLGDLPVYFALGSRTEAESNADTATRMKLYHELQCATPHHHRLTNTCKAG